MQKLQPMHPTPNEYTMNNPIIPSIKDQECKLPASQYNCPLEATIDVIGGKWKGIILYQLKDKPVRFNELRRLTPNVTQRMLTKQLRELEANKIIHREIYKEIPPKVEYSITEFGKTLLPVLDALFVWGEMYIGQDS